MKRREAKPTLLGRYNRWADANWQRSQERQASRRWTLRYADGLPLLPGASILGGGAGGLLAGVWWCGAAIPVGVVLIAAVVIRRHRIQVAKIEAAQRGSNGLDG